MEGFPYNKIVDYCNQLKPFEACGMVVLFKGKYLFVPCENVAEDKTNTFAISAKDFASVCDKGDVVCIVHSHPSTSSAPSEADKIAQSKQKYDWLIVSVQEATPEFSWLKTDKVKKDLYGRKYIWQVQDCGSFIIDFYKEHFEIVIPDFYRPERFWEKGLELYLEHYEEAGFYEIPIKEIQFGDVLLMNIGTHISCHGAVYAGDNKIAHHLNGRLSCTDVLGDFYRNRITKVLRHKERK